MKLNLDNEIDNPLTGTKMNSVLSLIYVSLGYDLLLFLNNVIHGRLLLPKLSNYKKHVQLCPEKLKPGNRW